MSAASMSRKNDERRVYESEDDERRVYESGRR